MRACVLRESLHDVFSSLLLGKGKGTETAGGGGEKVRLSVSMDGMGKRGNVHGEMVSVSGRDDKNGLYRAERITFFNPPFSRFPALHKVG